MDLEKTAEHSSLFKRLRDSFEDDRLAGQRDGIGAVERGNGNPVAMSRDQFLRLPHIQACRQHPAVGRHIHAAAPVEDDARSLAQIVDAGQMRRRNFADAVANHGGGADTPILPQSRQSDLKSENRRLRDGGLIQARFGFVPAQFIQQ